MKFRESKSVVIRLSPNPSRAISIQPALLVRVLECRASESGRVIYVGEIFRRRRDSRKNQDCRRR